MNLIYKSQRIGKDGRPFWMYKFRTMVMRADEKGGPSTSADDPRLTKLGKFLRRYNLDELPQIINILKGEMALVGPRPEVPSEFESLDAEMKKLLMSVKPGITSPASIWDFHEEEILRGFSDPHKVYCERIKKKKMELNREYIKNKSFWLDVKIFLKTLWHPQH